MANIEMPSDEKKFGAINPALFAFRSFPSSLWDRTVHEALSNRLGGTCQTIRYEAKPHNKPNWEGLSFGFRICFAIHSH